MTTYRELIEELSKLTDDQLDCDLAVELGQEDEVFPAVLRIADPEHELLDPEHPIIYVQ